MPVRDQLGLPGGTAGVEQHHHRAGRGHVLRGQLDQRPGSGQKVQRPVGRAQAAGGDLGLAGQFGRALGEDGIEDQQLDVGPFDERPQLPVARLRRHEHQPAPQVDPKVNERSRVAQDQVVRLPPADPAVLVHDRVPLTARGQLGQQPPRVVVLVCRLP